MIARHSLTVTFACPVDGERDTYEVTIETTRIIPVERILEAVAGVGDRKLYQEAAAVELARALGARVTLLGEHSGVETLCEAGTP